MKRYLPSLLLLALALGCDNPSQPPAFESGDIVVAAAKEQPTEANQPVGLVVSVHASGSAWTYTVAFQGHSIVMTGRNLRCIGHLNWSDLRCGFPPGKPVVVSVEAK